MKKGGKKSLGQRFWRYKYSGPIVFVPLIILAISVYGYMEYEKEFFTAWSCETITDYLLDKDVPPEFPTHNELTEKQHLRLHQINQECHDSNPFSPPNNHQ